MMIGNKAKWWIWYGVVLTVFLTVHTILEPVNYLVDLAWIGLSFGLASNLLVSTFFGKLE